MKYVGFHKGRPDDGYVCSSKYMIDEYRANPSGFQRKIIAFGTADEMSALETKLLQEVDAANNDQYYNRSNGDGKFYCSGHNEESKVKIGKASKDKKWYTNGVVSKRFADDEEIPEGFYPGKTNPKSTQDEASKQKISLANKNRVYYTDGVQNIMIKKDDVVPDGFRKGRTFLNNPAKTKIIYTDGIKNIMLDPSEEAPEGYWKGKTHHTKPLKGRVCYTNGTKNIHVLEGTSEIPEGFYRGFTKQKEDQPRERISEWYTNGVDNMYILVYDVIPEGFYPGITRRTKKK